MQSRIQQDGMSVEQAAHLVIAEGFGWEARKEMTATVPAQCKQLAQLLEQHNGPLGTSLIPELLEAWNRGYQACHLEITVAKEA